MRKLGNENQFLIMESSLQANFTVIIIFINVFNTLNDIIYQSTSMLLNFKVHSLIGTAGSLLYEHTKFLILLLICYNTECECYIFFQNFCIIFNTLVFKSMLSECNVLYILPVMPFRPVK